MNVSRRTARPWVAWMVISLLSQIPCSWAGEDQSELLYTRGLIPFKKGEEAFQKALTTKEELDRQEGIAEFQKALSLFQQAVAEDPPYDLALFYLGITYGKLGRYAEAVPYLQKTLERRPDFRPAQQDLAIAYYHLGLYRKALELLNKSADAGPRSAFDHYYIGLCHAGLKDYTAAIISLKRAGQLDPALRPYADYYAGLAYLAKGEPKEAVELLQSAGSGAQDSELVRTSLELSRKVSVLPDRQRAIKKWALRLGVGNEYDSNVVLEPDSGLPPDQITDKDAFSFTFSAGGSLDLWRTQKTYLTGDYDFYQSLHLELSDFDVQAHKLTLTGGWSPFRSLDLALQGGTNYYRVGDGSYLFETYLLPMMGFSVKPWEYTQIFYQWTNQDYLVSYYDPARDGNHQVIALRQYFLLKGFERYLFVGYHYDMEDPNREGGEDFQYRGNLFEAGMRTPGPWGMAMDLAYSFHSMDYEYPNSRSTPAFSKKRRDDMHWISFTLRKPLTSSLEVYANYRYTMNDSNIDVFQYDRHVSSIGLLLTY